MGRSHRSDRHDGLIKSIKFLFLSLKGIENDPWSGN